MKKLTEIQDVTPLNVEQSLTVKGGARDTRGGDGTATASPISGTIKAK